MTGVRMVEVAGADDGLRLDRWFRQHFPALGHGQLQRMLRKGQVRVDGAKAEAKTRLAPGQTIRVPPLPDAPTGTAKAEAASADREAVRALVLYRDDEVIALNKPFGLPVQGGSGVTRHVDGMLDGLAKQGERPRLVHRLDKDTGGVLLLGRTRLAAKALADAFARHRVVKDYWALTAGVPHPLSGLIDLPVEKNGAEGAERVGPSATGKRALTDYQVADAAGTKAAFVALRPLTGRTHQIRVHLASLGTPIVGDGKYGGAASRLDGLSPKMHLFCRSMTVPRPNRAPLTVIAPLTGHMAASWALFGFETEPVLAWPER